MATKHTTVTPTRSETKAESTNTAARSIIEKGNAVRDAKTKRLRAERIAAEAKVAPASASKTSPAKSRKKT